MPHVPGHHSALVRVSRELIERSRLAVTRLRDRAQQSRHLVLQSRERIVWVRDLEGEHEAAREAVWSFVHIARACGLPPAETLAILREMVHTAQKDAGDTQSGGALEQAVMRWGTAACSH